MPWPTELAQREVVVNDEIKATLSAIDPGQVKLQFPSAAPLGTQRIAVRVSDTGELVAGGGVIVAAAAPGLFTVSQDGKGQALAVNQDGRPNNTSNPATRGSTITLFGTGQGQVSPPVADGTPAPGDLSSNTVAVPTSDSRTCLTTQPSICVSVGSSSFGEIQYSGLAPGSIAMWQITIKIPQDVPPGNAVPVRALINATPSNVVTIAVR
jgi:adhesin/invasin